MNYFARVTSGLEQIAWQDIEQRTGAVLQGFGHRRIDFLFEGPPSALLLLRSVDDVYVRVAQFQGVGHTRADLTLLIQHLASVDFAPALRVISSLRPLGRRATYSVTASYLGKRNYSRYDLEDAAQKALSDRFPWDFKPNRPAGTKDPDAEGLADLDLRMLLEDAWVLLGLRLGKTPLHRREYKVASRPGSLKPPVAYCLGLLAGVGPGDALLDPMCGAGTILAEVASLITDGLVVGGDIDPDAVAATLRNLQAAGLPAHTLTSREVLNVYDERGGVFVYQGDVRSVHLPRQRFQAIISNLPWNIQVSIGAGVSDFYVAALQSVAPALAREGRIVCLTTEAEAFQEALVQVPQLQVERTLAISLFGKHPVIYVLHVLST